MKVSVRRDMLVYLIGGLETEVVLILFVITFGKYVRSGVLVVHMRTLTSLF